jgi:proton-translocating NADH-quinone oxidoreductase chain L
MLILVTGDNYLQLFLGWEGIGLASYLLINFWFARLQANKAAIKAMIVNRVGDVGLGLGIFAIYYQFQALDYGTVFGAVPSLVSTSVPASEITLFTLVFEQVSYGWTSLDLIGFLLFIGAVGKSAQLGLHTWLPDAMEGPTPVSALIHAATLVTAGVFLIARSSPLFEYAPHALAVITIAGAMTAFFAATTGLVQNDLKRVIAYSTCSQLGYMVFACGVSAYAVGVFHLANHAFFKALLFLSAGSVIHGLGDEQDLRRMGGIVRFMPITYPMIFIGSISLMGFPFMTGFYSKDFILEAAYASYTVPGHFAFWLGSLAAGCTAFYSIRLIGLAFLAAPNASKHAMAHVHESPLAMTAPLLFLSVGAIFLGYVSRDLVVGLGTPFWNNALFVHPDSLHLPDAEFIPQSMKVIPLLFSFSGVGLAYLIYGQCTHLSLTGAGMSLTEVHPRLRNWMQLFTFLNRKWFFDKVYNETLGQGALSAGYEVTYKTTDRGLLETFGPYGLSQTFYSASQAATQLQSGLIYHYAFTFLVGVTAFILLFFGWAGLTTFLDPRLLLVLGMAGFVLISSRKA